MIWVIFIPLPTEWICLRDRKYGSTYSTKGMERSIRLLKFKIGVYMKTIRLQIQATILKAILEIALFLPSLVINQKLFRVFGPAEQVLRLGTQKLSEGSLSMHTSFMGTNFSTLAVHKHAFQNWSSPGLVQSRCCAASWFPPSTFSSVLPQNGEPLIHLYLKSYNGALLGFKNPGTKQRNNWKYWGCYWDIGE